jgi:hypothetical protein
MIKVNELRVGNLVVYKQDNDELPVLKIDGDSKKIFIDLLLGLNMEVDEQDIDPIPLTSELLERCGFNKGNKYGLRNFWDGPGDICLADIDKENAYRLYGSEWTIGQNIKYLHHLQNLYYALTGEELQIKNI